MKRGAQPHRPYFSPRSRETIAREMNQFLSTGKSTLMGRRMELRPCAGTGMSFRWR